MPAVDRWIIGHLFAQQGETLRAWHQGHPNDFLFAVNLSGTTVADAGFRRYLKRQFEDYSIPYPSVCFEITETAAMGSLAGATAFIEEFSALGCRFALDDFGTGLSSYAYLRALGVHYLKIDGSFVRGLAEDPVNRAMVESINQIAHVLGLKTIAEWAEDEPTLAALRADRGGLCPGLRGGGGDPGRGVLPSPGSLPSRPHHRSHRERPPGPDRPRHGPDRAPRGPAPRCHRGPGLGLHRLPLAPDSGWGLPARGARTPPPGPRRPAVPGPAARRLRGQHPRLPRRAQRQQPAAVGVAGDRQVVPGQGHLHRPLRPGAAPDRGGQGRPVALPDILDQIRHRPERFILFCDDLSFAAGESGLHQPQGGPGRLHQRGPGQRPDLRHIQPPPPAPGAPVGEPRASTGSMAKSTPARGSRSASRCPTASGSGSPSTPSTRPSIWTSSAIGSGAWAPPSPRAEAVERAALQWALLRGSRSGRTAWQFARDWAGKPSPADSPQ